MTAKRDPELPYTCGECVTDVCCFTYLFIDGVGHPMCHDCADRGEREGRGFQETDEYRAAKAAALNARSTTKPARLGWRTNAEGGWIVTTKRDPELPYLCVECAAGVSEGSTIDHIALTNLYIDGWGLCPDCRDARVVAINTHLERWKAEGDDAKPWDDVDGIKRLLSNAKPWDERSSSRSIKARLGLTEGGES